MAKYYFTYGSSPEYPFYGGWTEIEATSLGQATNIFKAVHPNKEDSECLNCADYYTEIHFESSGMHESGNRGNFCHEQIKLECLDAMEIKTKTLHEKQKKDNLDTELAHMKANLTGALINCMTTMDRLIAGR